MKNVNVIVLAAGYGMRSFVTVPKALVSVHDVEYELEDNHGDMPNICHTIRGIWGYDNDLELLGDTKSDRISSITILTNLRDGALYHTTLASMGLTIPYKLTYALTGREIPLNVVVEEHSRNEEKWGAYYGAINQANLVIGQSKGIDKFLFVPGDGYFDSTCYRKVLQKSKNGPAIVVGEVPFEESIHYGNVKRNLYGVVEGFKEKPSIPIGKLVWTGMIAIPSRFTPLTPLERIDSWGTIVNYYIERNVEVRSVKIDGWFDIGNKYKRTDLSS